MQLKQEHKKEFDKDITNFVRAKILAESPLKMNKSLNIQHG